jgi:ACS family glucarate transporter-like MFS transporter/ACS family D-galactonate transporter-like MFS transporter
LTLYLHRYTFAAIKPKLQEEWGLGNVELGMLDSAFSLFYMLFQIPGGILADLMGAHYFLAAIVVLWSLALGLHGWAPNLMALRVVRAAFGTFQAGAYATLSRVTRNWFAPSVRTSVQGWMGVFFGRMGAAFSNLIFATFLIGILGMDWRTALYVFMIAGVALGVLIGILLRDSPRDHPLVNDAEVELIEERSPRHRPTDAEPARERPAVDLQPLALGEMVRRMRPRSIANLAWLNVQSTLSTIADAIYVAWIPAFLVQVHHLDYKEMGIYSSLPLFGGACGGAVGGMLNDLLIRRTGNRRWSRSAVGLAGKGVAGVTLLVALSYGYERPYVFCGMLFLVKFFGDWSLSTGWGTVTDIGGRNSATVFSFNNAVASGIAIPIPPIYGYIAREYSWHRVFELVAAIYLLCGLSWLLINCTIPLVREEPPDEDGGTPRD